MTFDQFGNPVAVSTFNSLKTPERMNIDNLLVNALASRQQLLENWTDPRRDINKECGYPETSELTADRYKQLYDREPIASRVVKCLPNECWQVTPVITDDEDAEEKTEFEKGIDRLSKRLNSNSYHVGEEGNKLWDYMRRVDILSRIGHFGVLLMGFNDGKNLQEPVEGAMVFNGQRHQDGFLTENELNHFEALSKGDLKDNSGNVIQPRLNQGEKVVFNQWKQERQITLNALQEDKKKASGWEGIRTSDVDVGDPNRVNPGIGLPGTDSQYNPQPNGSYDRPGIGGTYAQQFGSTYGMSPGDGSKHESAGGNLAGTDQQYFGIQFGPSEQPSQEPSKQQLELLFLRPFDESLVQVVRYEWNIFNPRFGMPVMYRITLNDPREQHSGVGLPMATVFVHWSRVIHVADNLNSSEIFGAPAMRPVLNRLLDLLKEYGGSAEMFWRGAFPGISLETHPQLGGDVTIDSAAIRTQMEQYQNGLQRYLALMGISAKTLSPQISDPASHIDKQIEAICIEIEMPKRVFMGSERGELSSSQDDSSWNDKVKRRQNNHVTPHIIVPFFDRLIQVGVLPPPVAPKPKNIARKPAEPQPPQGGFGGKPSFGKPSFGKQEEKPNDFTQNAFGDKPNFDQANPQEKRAGFGNPEDKSRNPIGSAVGKPNEAPPSPNLEQGKIPNETEDAGEGNLGAQEETLEPEEKEPAKLMSSEREAGYVVKWPDLDSNTARDKASIALTRTQALASYVGGNVEAILPLIDFLTRIMGFDQEEAEAILDAANEQLDADRMTDPGIPEVDQMEQDHEQFKIESKLKGKAIEKGMNPFEQKQPMPFVPGQPGQNPNQPAVDEKGNPLPPDQQQVETKPGEPVAPNPGEPVQVPTKPQPKKKNG